MASNKAYTVMKDGEILKELKNLAAARKLADTEDAEVFCGGLCVYAPDPPVNDDILSRLSDAVAEDPVEKESVPDVKDASIRKPIAPEKYTLTAKMNIRKAPSKTAEKLGVAQKGTIVDVTAIEGDWLHLADGSFILFEGGRFAEKM